MPTPNYLTPAGHKRLVDEMERLLSVDRPKVVQEVADAAAHGDRSENAEYIYGKRKLRQIDSRLQFLNSRLDLAQVVDPTQQKGPQVRFGATVTLVTGDGKKTTYQIVGVDEIDVKSGRISWQSPLGQALMGKKRGDRVTYRIPTGELEAEVTRVAYI
jgi:transcription elongation factor GreB